MEVLPVIVLCWRNLDVSVLRHYALALVPVQTKEKKAKGLCSKNCRHHQLTPKVRVNIVPLSKKGRELLNGSDLPTL